MTEPNIVDFLGKTGPEVFTKLPSITCCIYILVPNRFLRNDLYDICRAYAGMPGCHVVAIRSLFCSGDLGGARVSVGFFGRDSTWKRSTRDFVRIVFIFAFPPDVIWRVRRARLELKLETQIGQTSYYIIVVIATTVVVTVKKRILRTRLQAFVFFFFCFFRAVASTKVRVSFFESEKPSVLPSPPKSLEIFGDNTMTTSSPILQRSIALVQSQIRLVCTAMKVYLIKYSFE